MIRMTLRTKFLLALGTISAALTWATLLVVRQRVEVRVREEIVQGLENSVVTFRSLQAQREATLGRSAALLAELPPLKAVMTSRDMATIQDASTTFWKLIGSELFVLSDSTGKLMAVHTSRGGFTDAEAQESLRHSLATGESRSWWYGSGRLFEVFLQPIYFGAADENMPLGMVAVGFEIDGRVAADISRVAASQVAFRYEKELVASTVPARQRGELSAQMDRLVAAGETPQEIQLGKEHFLSTAVRLPAGNVKGVTLIVLKSYDEATAFLESLNHWIEAVGIGAVMAGSFALLPLALLYLRGRGLDWGEMMQGLGWYRGRSTVISSFSSPLSLASPCAVR